MARYKDPINYVAHNFNNTTILIDGEHKALAVHMIECEMAEDENGVYKVDDGTGIFWEETSREGVFKLQIMQASSTNNKLYELFEANNQFQFAVTDANSEEFNCSAQKCKIKKRPVEKRAKEHDVVEWEIISIYMTLKGGGYRLEGA